MLKEVKESVVKIFSKNNLKIGMEMLRLIALSILEKDHYSIAKMKTLYDKEVNKKQINEFNQHLKVRKFVEPKFVEQTNYVSTNYYFDKNGR